MPYALVKQWGFTVAGIPLFVWIFDKIFRQTNLQPFYRNNFTQSTRLRNSGATSLLMWEAIKFASTVSKKFDLEGSMLEPVERFFRGFGTVQKPYFTISKTFDKRMKAAYIFRDMVNLLRGR